MLRKIGIGLGLGVLLALVGLMVWEPFAASPGTPPPAHAYRADITRDEFGVPHIHGTTDADVTFGVGYAHAEDDFATLQDVLAMTRGRYGAIAGADGAKIDYALALLDARGTAQRHYGELPADVRALLEGYAAGLNKFAATHPGEVKLARLFPVNGEDVATGFALRQPFFFGLSDFIGPLVADTPLPREHGPVLDGSKQPDYAHGGGDQLSAEGRPTKPAPIAMGEDGALAGSNAFAVAPARSGDGVTRLVSNAHQPWRGGVAWYELVIESDTGWHFAGANFPGVPFPVLGHNDNLGWTFTVNRPDLTDIYKLATSADGTQYRLDGKWLPLERRSVMLPVRFGPLVIPVWKTVYRSAHGPAIRNAHGTFAMRYAGIDEIGIIPQIYQMTRARDVAGWQAAMATQGLPSFNAVYADRDGHIGYVYNARLPDRKPGFNWRGVLPGDRSDLIWAGPVAWAKVPQLVDPKSGFVFNSNNTPFIAAGPGSELDPKAFAPELGIETDVTNRTRRAVKLMAATNPIGREKLEAIKYDRGYERVGYVAWMLDAIAKLDVKGDADLARAQALIGHWDLQADGRNPGDALAVMVLKNAMKESYNLHAPPDARHELEFAAHHLLKYFGRLDPPLGDVERVRQGSVDYPMDGGGDTLRAATSWNIDPNDGRLLIKHGDSFVMFVEWPKNGPVASQSIQPFGAATTRPRSAHFADQVPLFSAHKLKPVRFMRDDIAAHAKSREVVSGD